MHICLVLGVAKYSFSGNSASNGPIVDQTSGCYRNEYGVLLEWQLAKWNRSGHNERCPYVSFFTTNPTRTALVLTSAVRCKENMRYRNKRLRSKVKTNVNFLCDNILRVDCFSTLDLLSERFFILFHLQIIMSRKETAMLLLVLMVFRSRSCRMSKCYLQVLRIGPLGNREKSISLVSSSAILTLHSNCQYDMMF